MEILLVISSFGMGFLGLMLDINLFQGDVILFSIAFFLSPSIYTIGRIYERLIHGNKSDENKKINL